MKLSAADTWFSKCIRHAANWTCQRCGKAYTPPAQGLDCSHHYGRSRRSVRWCKDNATALCMGCHRWWHEYPAESGKWLREWLGDGMVSMLSEKAREVVKVPKTEEKEIAKHYKKEYERMLKDGSRDFVSYQ